MKKKRIEEKCERTKQKIRILEAQKAEFNGDNNVIDLKIKEEKLKLEVQNLRLQNITKKEEFNKNIAFQRVEQLKNERKLAEPRPTYKVVHHRLCKYA